MVHGIVHIFCCPTERPSKADCSKSKMSHSLKGARGIRGKFLKDLICMDHTGQYQASSVWKCWKSQQLGPCFSVGVEGTRNSHFRWCRDGGDSRWWDFFGLMSYHSPAEPLQFVVHLFFYHCKWKVTSYRGDNQLMNCNLLRVVI